MARKGKKEHDHNIDSCTPEWTIENIGITGWHEYEWIGNKGGDFYTSYALGKISKCLKFKH